MIRLFSRPALPRLSNASTLARVYDAAAAGWQDGIRRLGFGAAYARLVSSAVPPDAGAGTVLDVGTGTGALAQAYVARFGMPEHLSLMDISEEMLNLASDHLPGANTIQARLGASLPHLPGQHVVLCAHVVEHCDDPQIALRWLFERLMPGGQLVLAVSKPHWCTALVRWRWGNAAYPPALVADMLASAGFENISVVPFQNGPPSRVSCGYTATRPD